MTRKRSGGGMVGASLLLSSGNGPLAIVSQLLQYNRCEHGVAACAMMTMIEIVLDAWKYALELHEGSFKTSSPVSSNHQPAPPHPYAPECLQAAILVK